MSHSFTRAELYELVWSEPVRTLAARFGVSDVALSKTCRRHHVPTPPVGWWARKEAGKAVKRTPLPRRDAPGSIVIHQGAGAMSEGLKAAKATARKHVASAEQDSGDAPPCPFLARTMARLRAGKPDGHRLVRVCNPGCFSVEVSPLSIDRVERILRKLGDMIAAQGFAFTAGEKAVEVLALRETVTLDIAEGTARSPHEPTAVERAKVEEWRSRTGPRLAALLRHTERRLVPEWDHLPTGRLSVRLDRSGAGGAAVRRTFADGKAQDVERMAGDIAVAIALVATAKREWKERCERQHREFEERERERREAARLAALEARRTDALDRMVADLERAERVSRFLEAASAHPDPPASYAAFLAWVRAHLTVLNSRLEPSAVAAWLVREGLVELASDGTGDGATLIPAHGRGGLGRAPLEGPGTGSGLL